MYSFAQRDDTEVVDEPLYGHYLRVSGAQHPGGDDVMATMCCDGDAVMRQLMQTESRADIRFIKHMAHHLIELDLGFLMETRNIFLIRDPQEMLPSLTVQVPHAGLADTGLKRQWDLYEALRAKGEQPAVVDSRELLLQPASVLEQLCGHLGIGFADNMLSWPAGARAEDGIWAKHWYHAVHRSTGFAPYVAKADFPDELATLLADCAPYYDNLHQHAIKAPL